MLLEYLNLMQSVTSLGIFPFADAERELEYLLQFGDKIIDEVDFPCLLRLMRVIEILHRPSDQIESKPSHTFLNKVFWTGLLTKDSDG